MADALGIKVSIELEALDKYLDDQGWRPPQDLLVRLARHNHWLDSLTTQDLGDPSLGVFVVREKALRRGGLEKLLSLLTSHGFDIVETKHLSTAEMQHASRRIRGGNWGRGPWPMSGGRPAAVVITYDAEPIPPKARHKRKFPFLTNARNLVKSDIREEFNRESPPSESCNVIHSSDNGREAWEFIQILIPEGIDAIRSKVAAKSAAA